MKKPEDFRKVWAWNEYRSKAEYMILVSELPKNKVLCVDTGFEEEFYNHDISYSIFIVWPHWSETDPRETERWMTREEILLDNMNHPRRLVRSGGSWYLNRMVFASTFDVTMYEYIDIPENYTGDFTDLPVKQYKIKEIK